MRSLPDSVRLVPLFLLNCLTICHRIMLHENLGEAHRKHAFQIMANELGIGHVKVASFYALLQLAISLGFVEVGGKGRVQ